MKVFVTACCDLFISPLTSLICSSACLLLSGFAPTTPPLPSRATQVCPVLGACTAWTAPPSWLRLSSSQLSPLSEHPSSLTPALPSLLLPSFLFLLALRASAISHLVSFPAGVRIARAAVPRSGSAEGLTHGGPHSALFFGHIVYTEALSGCGEDTGGTRPFLILSILSLSHSFLLKGSSPARA